MHETSFYIVIQTFAVDLDFDRCTVGSLKRSSCTVEPRFDQFKVNLFVPGAGRRLTQRDERLLVVVSIAFGVGETSCSQGIRRSVNRKKV